MACSKSAHRVPSSTSPTTAAARVRKASIRANPVAASSSASKENSTCER